jgi:hypothetical protein
VLVVWAGGGGSGAGGGSGGASEAACAFDGATGGAISTGILRCGRGFGDVKGGAGGEADAGGTVTIGGPSGANDLPSPSCFATDGRVRCAAACARLRVPARWWWSVGGRRWDARTGTLTAPIATARPAAGALGCACGCGETGAGAGLAAP